MKPKLRNLFFLVGVAAVLWMLFSFPFSWSEVVGGVRRAGICLPLIIGLWLPIYMLNALAWLLLLRATRCEQQGRMPSFARLLKLTVTGFALNYVTPVGLLGGEPYRILELQGCVGSVRATSSTILHSMMHILSHFVFWSFSIVLFLVLYFQRLSPALATLMLLCAAFCAIGLAAFTLGYRHGLAERILAWASRLPLAGHRIARFATTNEQQIREVDGHIANLHTGHPTTFWGTLFLEFAARMMGCVEILLILYLFNPATSYWDAVLIQAFTSLFANLVFFIPMQMGAREGGMAWSASVLQLGTIYGVLLGLIIRLRELFWIAAGILLMKLGGKR